MIDQITPNTAIRYSRPGKNAQYLHEISIDDFNGMQTQIDNLSRSPNLTIGGGYKNIKTMDKLGTASERTTNPIEILPVVELTVIPSIPRPNLSNLNKVSEAIDDSDSGKKEVIKGIAIIVVLLTVITLIAIFK